MEPIDRVRAYFAKDAFATGQTGIIIDTAETGYARCSLDILPIHYNSEKHVMGGVLFTLADYTFAVAANFDQPMTVTLSSQITFLSPPRGDRLVAEAHCVRQGHSTCYYQVTIRDDTDTIVTVVGISGFIKRG